MPPGSCSDPPPAPAARLEGTAPFAWEVPWLALLPPGVTRPPLVVGLHGQGETPERFARILTPLLASGLALLLPAGPLPLEVRRGRQPARAGWAWYVYDGDTPAFRASALRSEAWLLRLLDEVLPTLPVAPVPPALLGFSQGAYLAGIVGFRQRLRFSGLVVCGGRVKTEMLTAEISAAAPARWPVLLLHGSRDPFVPVEAAHRGQQELQRAGVAVEAAEFEGGHELNPEALRPAGAFLRRILSLSQPGPTGRSSPPPAPLAPPPPG